MSPSEVRAIRTRLSWSQTKLAALLRIKDIRTIQRWESGEVPVSGPASIVLEMLDRGELPELYLL